MLFKPRLSVYRYVFGLSLIMPATVDAAHPLITEDTGTQGAGRWQIELTTAFSRDEQDGSRQRSQERTLVASYGLHESLDGVVTIPYSRVEDRAAGHISHGFTDSEVALKWRFYADAPWSAALRAGLSLASGDRADGLSQQRNGASVFVILSYESPAWQFHSHVGHSANRNRLGERESLLHYSVALGISLNQTSRLVADFSRETHPDPAVTQSIRSAVIGLIHAYSPAFDVDMGYRWGLSEVAADSAWLAGLTWRF